MHLDLHFLYGFVFLLRGRGSPYGPDDLLDSVSRDSTGGRKALTQRFTL